MTRPKLVAIALIVVGTAAGIGFAFAYGAHVCLGMHLARMETRVLLETLFDRLPNLHLDPDAHDVHISGLIFRSPQSLPVRFDAVPQA